MPDADAKTTYNLQLTEKEMRLIGLGLSGILKDKTDIAEARKLNAILCAIVVKNTRERLAIYEGNLEKARQIAEGTIDAG